MKILFIDSRLLLSEKGLTSEGISFLDKVSSIVDHTYILLSENTPLLHTQTIVELGSKFSTLTIDNAKSYILDARIRTSELSYVIVTSDSAVYNIDPSLSVLTVDLSDTNKIINKVKELFGIENSYIKYKSGFDEIGSMFQISFHVKYETNKCMVLPKSCVTCPVGFECNQNRTCNYRPNCCELEEISIDTILDKVKQALIALRSL